MKKNSETPPAELPSLPPQIRVVDDSPVTVTAPLHVQTSPPTRQDIPREQDLPSLFGMMSHLEQLTPSTTIDPPLASHYSSVPIVPSFQSDLNVHSNGMQQFSNLPEYNSYAYNNYTNGHGYSSEAQDYEHNQNYQSYGPFDGNASGDYGSLYDYENPYNQ